jgi:hypothetical protein
LPKVSSSDPLSPQRGERARVRGDKKNLLAMSINILLHKFRGRGALLINNP